MPLRTKMVGRTPWSAADAPAGLVAPFKMLISLSRQRVRGDPRGPGGPPHRFCHIPLLWAKRVEGKEGPRPPVIGRPTGPLWLAPAAPDLQIGRAHV